jgi:NAD(P)-dependent dehydrogenase (short-subunit alcohol dehydrogenase family)
MAVRLAGKTAMVIGAGSVGPGWGNGKATAVLFAREGARVFCVDLNEAAARETAGIIRGEGGEAEPFRADASRAADVEHAVAACLKRFGRIDVLDNNVGIVEVGGVVELAEEAWDRVFAVNLLASDEARYVTGIELMVDGGITLKVS